jgi:NDP-sugar pyrophosphorylase family protein
MTPSRIISVVLAGGQGQRIRHLLPDLPKPMAQVHGRPFIEWIVRFLTLQGIHKFIISLGYKAEVIASHFESLALPGIEVSCVAELQPQGTAGGFLQAIAHVPAPDGWLVCNGDSLVLTSLLPLFDALEGDCTGALLGVRVPDASNYGTLDCDAHGTVQRFAEKRPGQGLVNAGVYLLKGELVSAFSTERPLSFETDVFPRLLSTGVVLRAVPVTAAFLDIGTPETLGKADQFIANNLSCFHHPLC